MSQKKWDQYPYPIKHRSAGYIFNLKGGSIAPSQVQKHFCTISGTRGISKKIRDTRFQEFEIMTNFISLNLIPPVYMHTFSSYEHFRGLENIPF